MGKVKEEPQDESGIGQTVGREVIAYRKSSRIAAKRESTTSEVDISHANDAVPEMPAVAKSPKVKVKAGKSRDQKMFGFELRSARWKDHGIDPNGFDIDESFRILRDSEDGLVPRLFMANTYGGSPQDVMPKISAQKYEEHGFKDNFMYLGCDYQPCAPIIPGSPGLWISVNSSTSTAWRYGIVRVFTKVQDHTPRLWQYQGQYKVRPSRPISQAEWEQQSPTVRNTWISDLQSQSWGANMRARIYGRKVLEPNISEAYIKEVQKQGLDKTITKEEIALALQCGQEQLVVFTMECIGYEDNFQRHLIDKHLAWKAAQKLQTKKPRVKRKREPEEKPKVEKVTSHPPSKKRRVKAEA